MFLIFERKIESKMINDLLILNAFYTYRHLFLPRDVRNIQRTERLQRFLSFNCNFSSAADVLENDVAFNKDMRNSEAEIVDY